MELVRFDMQAMENAEVSGIEYQQGTLAGYEAREHGFKTGDIVKAIVPKYLKRAGTHVGWMSAKASGAFTLNGVPDIGKNSCRKLQRADGYGYCQRSV